MTPLFRLTLLVKTDSSQDLLYSSLCNAVDLISAMFISFVIFADKNVIVDFGNGIVQLLIKNQIFYPSISLIYHKLSTMIS